MDIDSLSGHDFEDLIEELIKKLGFITEERKRSADGGIDIRAISEKPIFKGLYIIQCKRHSKTIGEAIIRDLFGVVSSERANKGILITSSRFTKSAKDFARNKPIELIDGDKFLELLGKNISNKKAGENLKGIEKYSITLRYLEEGTKKIKKRRQAIMSGSLYLGSKYFKSEKSYFDFVSRKSNKLQKIGGVFENQLKNIFNIWNSFSEDQNNFTNIQELKNQCNELVETLNILEEEQEKIISTTPPDNYHLMNINNSFKNVYNQFFEVFFSFLTEVWMVVNDPENPRIQEKIENGVISFKYKFSITEFENIFKEIKQYNDDKVRQYTINNNQKSRCFVATAIYEDVNAIEVIKLRYWRDEVLSKNIGGTIIINIYYFFGPYYANLIKNFPIIKKITKSILNKIIKIL